MATKRGTDPKDSYLKREGSDVNDSLNLSPGQIKPKNKANPEKISTCQLLRSLWNDPLKRQSLYVLLVCTITYMFNQVDRYLQTIEAEDMQKDQGWGPGDGTGYQEDILVGAAFTAIYLPSGIPIGFLADRLKQGNKKYMFGCFLALWSLAVLGTGITEKWWQVLVLRFVLGFAESGCTPLAGSIIADSFGPKTRGTAYGMYNWGIYTGYSLAVGAANAMTEGTSWRTVYYTFGSAGLIWVIFVFLLPSKPTTIDKTIKNVNSDNSLSKKEQQKPTVCSILKFFAGTPSILILIFASLIRNAAGYVWGTNSKNFFQDVRGQDGTHQAVYMSWIPLVAGSMGALVGGIVSDNFVKNSASWKRLVILVASNLCAAPFAFGALVLPVPWCYLCLIPSNVIGEMWVGICLALMVELVPKNMKTTSLSIYFFIIGIGGFFPTLVTPIENIFDGSLQAALIVLFPGLYVVSSVIFLLALTCLKRDERKKKEKEEALIRQQWN